LKILEVSTSTLQTPPEYGGAIESYVYGLSNALSKMGHEVHVLGVRNPAVSYDEITFHGVNAHGKGELSSYLHLPGGSIAIPQLLSKTIDAFSAIRRMGERFDVVHCHFMDTALGYLSANRLEPIGTKSFFHLHNVPEVTLANRYLLTSFLKGFDGIFPVSEYVSRNVSKLFPRNLGTIRVVYNAVDCEEFQGMPPIERPIFLPFGTKMLYVGRMIRNKGLHYVLEDMTILKNRNDLGDLHLLAVGPAGDFGGSSRESYIDHVKAISDREGLDERVHFLGNVDKESLRYIFRSSDFIVVPSSWGEPCPTVVLEAMACGKAVLAFDDGGVSELVENGKTGLLVNRGEVLSLTSGMSLLGSDKELRLRMGKAAMARVSSEFSFHSAAQRLTHIFSLG